MSVKGRQKRRLSWGDKLRILAPTLPLELTEQLLGIFQSIFAYRYSQASTTKPGQGPRSWTKLIGSLEKKDIVRHLLGIRASPLQPVWIAARSLGTSLFFCLDVDADRTLEQQIEDEYGWNVLEHEDGAEIFEWWRARRPILPPIPSFSDRCRYVEDCLRWLGINPDDPSQVLIETTPRGGRHYYVFFDEPYHADQYRSLLEMVGLKFGDGQIEFFPRTNKPLRLPFGHHPHLGTRPHAWLNFVRRWNQGKIKRHSLAALYDVVNERINAERPEPPAVTIAQLVSRQKPSRIPNGIPRYRDSVTPLSATKKEAQRYLELIEGGPRSMADAQELLDLGILIPGTRISALKHLAAHRIFIEGQSAKEATKALTAWAMNQRHDSRDIRRDLAAGTTVVGKDIQRMCQWYEKHRTPDRPAAGKKVIIRSFATAEISALRSHLQHLPGEEKVLLAQFLLHFLQFAKLYGSRSNDNSGWESQVHVNKVIRKWPGCHHLNYKNRISVATALGLLSITKGAWHNPKGKGRARTYHLAIPVVSENEWLLRLFDLD